MNINICFFKLTKNLSQSNELVLRNVINEHAQKAMHLLKINNINIVVYPKKELTVPEVGAGGYAPNSDWIQIAVDPTRTDIEIKEIIEKKVPLSVYHEINHVARWLTVGYGEKIPETLISEGLAIVFAERNWSLFRASWGEYSEAEIKTFLEILRHRDAKSKYNHSEWFFGKGKPKWLGYKVGTYIVRKVLLDNKISIEELTKLSANEVLKLSGVKL